MLASIILLSGCRSQTYPPIETLTPGPPPVNSPQPNPQPSAALPQVTRPQPTQPRPAVAPSPTAGPLAAPKVLHRYELPYGLQGESIEATPGRIWVGVTSGELLEYDAASGDLLSTLPLAPDSFSGIAPVIDLAFDGQHLWAMVVWRVSVYTQKTELIVLNPAARQVVQRINVTDQDPEHFGLTPGRVWTQNLVFDAATLEPSAVIMNSDATVFGSDGQGGIWAGGANACDTCPSSLYRYPVDDIFNARPGPADADRAVHLLAARQRLWVATDGMMLYGYNLDENPGIDTPPAASLDLSTQMELPPAAVLFDGTALWLLSSVGSGGGMLYQLDPISGQQVNSIAVGDREVESGRARVPVAAAFDGRDIWVLTSLDLAQVGLPWTR